MDLPDRTQAKSWEGRDVADSGGQRLGRCVGVFADTATGVPEWLDVDVEGHGRRFVPALEATDTGTVVRVRFSVDQVAGAPRLGDEDQLSKAEEVELYRHYGVPVESSDSGSLLPTQTGDTTETAERPDTGEHAPAAAGGAAAAGAAAGVAGTSAEADDTGTGLGTRPDADTAGAGPDTTVPAGLVETGEDLPVLDPAAASVPVPEREVGYVDQPEDVATDEPAAAPSDTGPAPAAPALPPPTLRRVGQGTTPPAAPAPSSGSAGPDLAAAAPLGALAAGVAALVLVLRAREARQRRRNAPAARADRLRKTLQAGSAAALAQAGSTLSGVPDAAAQTRRSAAEAAAKAGRSAARRRARASRSAARTSRRQQRQAAAALAAASSAAAQQRRQAAARVAAASAAASRSARDASSALGGASRSGSSRARRTTRSVAAAPTRVAKRGRKARRSVARTLWDLVLMSAAGGGYVLGAKAGRERYDELAQVAGAVAASPQVQAATASVRDPQRRADLIVDVQQQAASLVGRRGEHRG